MLTHWHRLCAAALVLLGCASAASATAPYPSLRVSIVKPADPDTAQAQVETGKQATLSAADAIATSDSAADENHTDTPAAPEATHSPLLADTVATPAEPVTITPPAPLARTWSVSLADGTVRQALARWALDANWTVAWEVPVDIPLTAGADLATTPDFHEAVAVLADAVAMGETPIRPCFYANQVVRLLPYNAVCDRTGTRPPSPNP